MRADVGVGDDGGLSGQSGSFDEVASALDDARDNEDFVGAVAEADFDGVHE